MEKQIEVELIGNLTEKRFNELREFFNKNGKFKKEKDRLTLMYFRDKIPKNLYEIKDEKVDLRLRITNKQAELILKYGLFTAIHAREEVSVNLNLDDFEKYVQFLSYLGWNNVVIYATKTFVYTYKDIEFSLVDIKDFGYTFEAEILTNKNNTKKAETKIMRLLKELNLKTFNKNELNKQCNEINNNKNLQFDFNQNSVDEIKNRFKEFF